MLTYKNDFLTNIKNSSQIATTNYHSKQKLQIHVTNYHGKLLQQTFAANRRGKLSRETATANSRGKFPSQILKIMQKMVWSNLCRRASRRKIIKETTNRKSYKTIALEMVESRRLICKTKVVASTVVLFTFLISFLVESG